jgi:hypothetical protein
LGQALDPATGLYQRQLRDRRWDTTLGTENLTSTAICLIGISRADIAADAVKLDPARTLAAMIGLTAQSRYFGGIGLVIWANAVWKGAPLDELLARWGASLDDLPSLVQPHGTMEAAWLVSGLAHELNRDRQQAGVKSALARATDELLNRYEPAAGIFYHATSAAPFAHRMRRCVPNFADQIYPVQALSQAAIVAGDPRCLPAAEASAKKLASLQGELGQWWWHYDPRDGEVAGQYPVYSVHQHAMAPMALTTLRCAGGADLGKAAGRGRAWLRNNELDMNMVDAEASTIWRDIEYDEGRVGRTIRHAQSVLGWKTSRDPGAAVNLKVNCETRPYEWAWCLFAGALKTQPQKGLHVV